MNFVHDFWEMFVGEPMMNFDEQSIHEHSWTELVQFHVREHSANRSWTFWWTLVNIRRIKFMNGSWIFMNIHERFTNHFARVTLFNRLSSQLIMTEHYIVNVACDHTSLWLSHRQSLADSHSNVITFASQTLVLW